MKIAVFTNQFPTKVSTFFSRDICALTRSGCQVEIFPLYPVNQSLWRCVPESLRKEMSNIKIHYPRAKDLLHFGRSLVGRSGTPIRRSLLQVGKTSVSSGVLPFLKNIYSACLGGSWAVAHGGRFDQVLAYWGSYAGTAAAVFCSCNRTPCPFAIFLHAGADLYRRRPYLPQKLRAAEQIIVVCDYNRRFLQRIYPDLFPEIADKICLHHLGIDLSDYSYRPSPRWPQKVIAVGAFDRRKGFRFLVRAIACLASQGFSVPLELVGEGEDDRVLRRLRKELQVEGLVRFRGWLRPDEVKTAIAGASVLVHPSTEPGDAVPTVIKEALALGTPVVASSVAGIPELLERGTCGLLVEPQKEELIADAVLRVLSDKNLWLHLSRAGRRQAERRFDVWRNGAALAGSLGNRNL